MSTFAVRLDVRETERAIRQLRDRAPIAISRALNRAAGSARTVMVREVARDMGLKSGTVRDQVQIDEARPSQGDISRLRARLSVSGKRIPLIDFGARGPEPSRGKGRGVSAKLPGGKGRYPNAFIATMRSGHRGVFARSTTKRLPIYELRGPSLPHVFTKYMPLGLARGQEALVTNLAHELRFALQQQPSVT